MSSTLQIYVFFTANKIGKTGLSPTIDMWKVQVADGTTTLVVSSGLMTAVGGGLYRYTRTNVNLLSDDYVAVAKTSDTSVDQQEIPALLTRSESNIIGIAGLNNNNQVEAFGELSLDYATQGSVDANVASVAAGETVIRGIKAKTDVLPADPASNTQVNTRMAAADYAAPPSAAEITNAVWSAVTRTLSAYPDSAGVATLLGRIASAINITNGRVDALASVDSATIADAVWDDPITGRATNTMGYVVARLSGTRLAVNSLVGTNGEMRAIYDDDYLSEDGRAMPLSAPPNISLTGALIKLEISAIPDTLLDGVVDSATAAHVDIPRSVLSALVNTSTNYRAYAILRQGASNEAHITLSYGILSVRKGA